MFLQCSRLRPATVRALIPDCGCAAIAALEKRVGVPVARRKHRETRDRVRLSDQQILAKMNDDLATLEVLVEAYDLGKSHVAGSMATSIINILDVKARPVSEIRGKLSFPTPAVVADRTNLFPTHRLVGARVGGDPPVLAFTPVSQQGWGRPPNHQSFKVWWETEPVYVAGSMAPGEPAGMINLDPLKQVPWDDREKFTRQQLCTDLRNCVGAHPLTAIPAMIADLYKLESFGPAFEHLDPDTGVRLSSEDGTLAVTTLPVQAAVRQIAEELLIAFGRRPVVLPPASEGAA